MEIKTVDCFNAARNKPKLLIIGHARHGKDTFADLVVNKMGLSFVSSSEFVGRVAIWEQWGKERYAAFSDMFEDRVNHRGLWFNFIVAYNTPNLSRTGEEMMAAHDVYVGMRNPDEFKACVDKDLFDYVIWVDASQRHPPEDKSSNGMTKDMADIWIDNNGPEINLQVAVNNLQNRLHKEGFDVNWEPMEMYTLDEKETAFAVAQIAMDEDIHDYVDPDLETDTEHYDLVVGDHPEPTYVDENRDEPMADRIARIEASNDPHDPPVQRPLVINSDKPTLKEYMGIINPPMVPDPNAKLPMDWNDMSEGELRCNGDCGCEDGSLCHEDVCGPINEMTVDRTLEEDRKFHNDALMAACPTPLILPAAPSTPNILRVGYQGGAAPAKPFTDADWHKSVRKLEWEDMPEGATKVLDHGFFKVIGVMGTDQAIVDAARMSYGRGTKTKNTSEGLIRYLIKHGHTSPLEMAEIKFHIRMPIFVMRQWVRHRTANLNEYSGRYSKMLNLFYVPKNEQICLQDQVNKQGSAEPLEDSRATAVASDIVYVCKKSFQVYEELLAKNVSRETARIVLPLNTYTEVVWKLDISNLIKFLRLRDDDHAQWETRQYAILVSKAVEENFPLVFAAYQEARHSHYLSEHEIYAMVTCNYDDLSASQAKRISDLRDQIL